MNNLNNDASQTSSKDVEFGDFINNYEKLLEKKSKQDAGDNNEEFGEFISKYDLLLTDPIPENDQSLLNLSRRLSVINDLPSTIDGIGNRDGLHTSMTWDISMAARRSLPSTDDEGATSESTDGILHPPKIEETMDEDTIRDDVFSHWDASTEAITSHDTVSTNEVVTTDEHVLSDEDILTYETSTLNIATTTQEGDPSRIDNTTPAEVTPAREEVTNHEDDSTREEVVQTSNITPTRKEVTDYEDTLVHEPVPTHEVTSTPEVATTTSVMSPTHEVTSTKTLWLRRTPEVATKTYVISPTHEVTPTKTLRLRSTPEVTTTHEDDPSHLDILAHEDVSTQESTPTPDVASTTHKDDSSHEAVLTCKDVSTTDDVPSHRTNENSTADGNDGKEIEDSPGSFPTSVGSAVEAVAVVGHLKEDENSEEEIDDEDSSDPTYEEEPSSITATNFKPSRRASYHKKCEYEKFSTAPYKTGNMAGFITNRPSKWVSAFISYAKEVKKTCRCKQEKDDTGACKEFSMFLISEESKQVLVCIKLVTGYVSIKGAGFQAWIDSDFPLVAKYVNTNENSIVEEKPEETRGEGEEQQQTKEKPVKSKDEYKENNDVAQLWEENKMLRNAMATLETAIQAVQTKECACKDNTDEESIRRMFDQKVAELEKKYDDKLMTFQKTLEHDHRTEIKEAKKVIYNKIGNLHDDFIQHKQSTEDEYNGMFYKLTDVSDQVDIYSKSQKANTSGGVSSELKESIAEIEARMKEIADNMPNLKTEDQRKHEQQDGGLASDIKNIGAKLNSMASNMDTLTSAYNGLINQLTGLQQNSSARVDRLSPPAPVPPNTTVNYPPSTQQNSHNPIPLTHPPVPNIHQHSEPTTLMNVQCNKEHVISAIAKEQLQNDVNIDKHESTSHDSETTIDDNTELLILIDSNSKHVVRRRFWTLDKTNWRRCGTILEAGKEINKTQYSKLQYVLVSVGTNDTDDEDGPSVARRLLDLVNMIKLKYPGTKIVLNEVTPRKGARDKEVIDCNKVLIDAVANDDRVFLAKQSNLRDPEYTFFFDEKHIKSDKIGRYVNNIKIALRKAYGNTDYRQSNMVNEQYTRSSNNFQRRSPQYSFQQPQPYQYNNENNVRTGEMPRHQTIHDLQTKKTVEAELKYEIRRRLLTLFD